MTSAQLDALEVVVDLGFDDVRTRGARRPRSSRRLALARAANELAADAEHIGEPDHGGLRRRPS